MAYSFTAASNQYLSTASAPAANKPMTLAAFATRTDDTSRSVLYTGVFASTQRSQLTIRSLALGNTFLIITNGAQFSEAGSPSTNTWFHGTGVESSDTSRTAYLNAVAGSTSTNSAAGSNYTALAIGAVGLNNAYDAITWNGNAAEVALWKVALTDAEIASLAKGFKPHRIRPQSLVFYAPLIRNLTDRTGGLTITNNNSATVADHPRVY